MKGISSVGRSFTPKGHQENYWGVEVLLYKNKYTVVGIYQNLPNHSAKIYAFHIWKLHDDFLIKN